MKRNAGIFCFAVIALAALAGCGSKSDADQAKKAQRPLDKIQGKAQVLTEAGGSSDAALNQGGQSLYIWEGARRYRLFMRTAAELVHGNQYVAEGVYAQKMIEEIGDPEQGKGGYPLQSSCEKAVKGAWSNLAFDAVDAQASLLRARILRYPARPVFLVTRIRPATEEEAKGSTGAKKDDAKEQKVPEVAVAADKQRASLVQGSQVQTAPLFEPNGGSIKCKVIIDPEGKVSELETGAQLCEAVDWSQFSYKPLVQGGKPVKVSTEVEMRFEPRKSS
jgi:hypothetical protein